MESFKGFSQYLIYTFINLSANLSLKSICVIMSLGNSGCYRESTVDYPVIVAYGQELHPGNL